MKKILVVLSVLLLALFIVYNVGFKIGDTTIGKQYDDIETEQKYDIENSDFSDSYLKKGQVSVINLWASWCKPCIEEMPIIEKLQKDFPQHKFANISIDKDEKDLRGGIEKFHVKSDITIANSQYRKAIRNFLENRDLKSLIKTEIVPITYIVKDGKVVHKETGMIEYEKFTKILSKYK